MNSKINIFTGQFAANLIFIDISGTLLDTLTSNLGKLKYLIAEKSQLRRIDTILPNLRRIHARKSNLEQLCEGMTKLKFLDCRNSRLTLLPSTVFNDLEFIYISNTKISTLNTDTIPNVQELHISNSGLVNLDLTALKNLVKIRKHAQQKVKAEYYTELVDE